jgi:co-chaperonin GroES (HSP10)
MPKNFDKDVKTEGLAEVLAVGPGKWFDALGDFVDHGLRPGDKVLYRGFLRYAHQLGDIFGEERATDVFAISADDLFAKVEGHGTLGANDEYQL